MNSVFISHVEEDAAVAQEIADGLAAAGYEAWMYERASLPGVPYVSQVLTAIRSCSAVMVVLSPASLASMQVEKEIIEGHEDGKPFIPLLLGLKHSDLRAHKPEWAWMMGAATSVEVPSNGAGAIVPRVIAGLQQMGLEPGSPASEAPPAAVPESAPSEPELPAPSAAPSGSWIRRPAAKAAAAGLLVAVAVGIAVPTIRSKALAPAGPSFLPAASAPTTGVGTADAGPPHGQLLYRLDASSPSLVPQPRPSAQPSPALKRVDEALEVTVSDYAEFELPVGVVSDFVARIRTVAVAGRGVYRLRFHRTGTSDRTVQFMPGRVAIPPSTVAPAANEARSCCGDVDIWTTTFAEANGQPPHSLLEGLAPGTVPGRDKEEITGAVAVRGPAIAAYVNGKEVARGTDPEPEAGGMVIEFGPMPDGAPLVVRLTGLEIFGPSP